MNTTHLRIVSRLASGALSFLVGCVHAPDVAVVTEHTALERQAAGEYTTRSNALEEASLSPGPDPIPREQLASHGEPMRLGVVDDLVASVAGDESRVDSLLVARCIGEATTGLLELTTDTCAQDADTNEVTRLVNRVNVHRRQVWAFLVESAPGTTEAEAREQWRVAHQHRIACGAQVQAEDGRWKAKTCAE